MKDRTKENAIDNALEVIKNSWTWERLTTKERTHFIDKLLTYKSAIKGSYYQRGEIISAMYAMYLYGLGYEPLTGWRTPKGEEGLPFC